ncbi:hypothetical protein ACPUVO_07310 [Pseudocolwellia sp. HL-MZ19]|uniref:hypothetical protein n=1 Tax=unclassified Pseudocolwellia TaxID=2848178 RepID=UPI003CF32B42
MDKFFLLIVVLTFSNVAYSNSSTKNQNSEEMERVSLKCDVIYVGGNRSIYYHHYLPKAQNNSFESDLMLRNKDSANKIYKINECVETDNKFTDPSANELEETFKSER